MNEHEDAAGHGPAASGNVEMAGLRRGGHRTAPGAIPTSPKPPTISIQTAGSGTALSETPSRTVISGRPFGVPIDRKVSACVAVAAVKRKLALNQPVKPSLGLAAMLVNAVSPPKLTFSCSVVAHVRLINCEAAQTNLRLHALPGVRPPIDRVMVPA